MPDRLIRDELLTSERYWSCSPEARNLFLSILLSADDTGRFTGANFALRTKCMAGTVTTDRLETILSELIKADLVRSYPQGKARFLFVPRFGQRLRYIHSKYPEPPKEINDITEKKPVPSQSQVSPKTAEVKRSEVKRSEVSKPSVVVTPYAESPHQHSNNAPDKKHKINGNNGRWDSTDQGIEAKGRELGIKALPHETFFDYKRRLWTLINLQGQTKPVDDSAKTIGQVLANMTREEQVAWAANPDNDPTKPQ